GSEGGGVADVLFRKPDGSVAYEFRGQLPFSWPAFAAPRSAAEAQPLFPVGHGLPPADEGALARLPEDPGAVSPLDEGGVLFARGNAAPPWRLTYTDAAGAAHPVEALPIGSSDGMRLSRIDHEFQEDALRVVWSGGAPGSVQLVTEESVNVTRETNG